MRTTSFGRRKPPPGSGAFQLEPEVGAVDRAGELEPDPLVPHGSGPAEEAAAELDGLRHSLDCQIALHDELAVLDATGGLEAELGIARGVEEVGRLQVSVACLVERRDRCRVDRPFDGRVLAAPIVPVNPGTRPFT